MRQWVCYRSKFDGNKYVKNYIYLDNGNILMHFNGKGYRLEVHTNFRVSINGFHYRTNVAKSFNI